MFILRPFNSDLSNLAQPRTQLEVRDGKVSIQFEIELSRPYTSDKFNHEFENWGLWEYDVFEAFLTRSENNLPYLEIQVSPLNQNFALTIEEPRNKTEYPKSMPFGSKSSLEGNVWKGEMTIPLENIPGDGKILKGNLHAILGQRRDHFSLNLNRGDAPDFHRPEYFKDLGWQA